MEAIRAAGVERIYRHGFEAMKLRDLAADVGIQAGSLYNHIAQKEEFLFDLLREIMRQLHEGLARALEGAAGPRDRLERFTEFHLRWHTARRQEVFIGNMELRSLTPEHRKAIVSERDAYEGRLRGILAQGNAEGAWSVVDPAVTTFAIVAMLTGVCNWYSPDGRLSQDELVEIYRDLVLNTVGVLEASKRHGK